MSALLLQTFLFQQSLRKQIRTESVYDHQISLTKMQEDISAFIRRIRNEMLTIYNEHELVDSLCTAAEEDVSLKDYYWSIWYFARKKFQADDMLLSMYLYDTKDDLVSAYRYDSAAFPRNIYSSDFDANSQRVKEYIHSDRTDMMVSGYYNPHNEKNIARFVLKLHTYDEARMPIGYLVCDIDSAALTSIMEKYVDVEQVCAWLQPAGDQTVALASQNASKYKDLQSRLSASVKKGFSVKKLEQEYDRCYLIHVPSQSYDLEAFVLVSQDFMSVVQKSLFRSLLIIMAAIILILVILVFLLSSWITKPVEEMQKTIMRIKNGETQLRVRPVGWSQELAVLGSEFNEMLDRIQAMVREEYQQKMLMERAEYKMLQAQINPHFLYNTLNTMSGIANAQNCPLVSGLCSSLSAIFRYSLNMTDEFSTVQKEMNHVRNYLYVMDVRNGSSVKYDYQIENETLKDSLPRLCLQPIVENALTHGLRNVRRKDKFLLIDARHIQDTLVITIRDNGIGMDAASMNALLEANDRRRIESGVSIGIFNVNARLKQIFGTKYGISVESAAGEGTSVKITVPIVPGKEN